MISVIAVITLLALLLLTVLYFMEKGGQKLTVTYSVLNSIVWVCIVGVLVLISLQIFQDIYQ
jgi:hypothetical protein